MSSSTTNTIGVTGDSYRLQQRRLTERLREDVDGAALDHARTNRLITLSGDEHDRNVEPAAAQLVLEVGSAHAGHRDVEDEAAGPCHGVGGEEIFSGGEDLDGEAELRQQIGERLAHRLVVIDHRHQWTSGHYTGYPST